MEDYAIVKQLGASKTSVVYQVVHKQNGKVYAMKIYKCNNEKQKERLKFKEKVNKEFQIQKMLSLHCRNIVKVFDQYESIDDNNKYTVCIRMEVCEKSLKDLQKERLLSEAEIKIYFEQLVRIIIICHRNDVIHRDIKPHNILIKNGRLKLADFGFAEQTTEKMTKFCGTPNYIAPEIVSRCRKHKYSGYYKPVDIWSLGIVLYVLFFGRSPFQGDCVKTTYGNVRTCKYKFPNNYETRISQSAKNLIEQLLQPNSDDRPTAEQILTHGWFHQ